MYEALIRPLLFRVNAEAAHTIGIEALSLFDIAPSAAAALRKKLQADRPRLHTRLWGIDFPNPLGIAAGLDKNAEAVVGLFALGFGFLEVGTVTPRPQVGNPSPRMFRLPEHEAVINRMGFNNAGVAAMAGRLRELHWRPAPIGINIGKNKDTAIEEALSDYVTAATELQAFADYIAVNVSSPNTPGLRSLQEPKALQQLLIGVRKVVAGRPLLLKIAPDLTNEAIDETIDVAMGCRIDGLICTNTTIDRSIDHPMAAESGGLSGRPLFVRSTEIVRRVYRKTGGRLPIVGVGGIVDAETAWQKLTAGASLIQLYTGFIYGGPRLPARILRALEEKVSSLGLSSIAEAIGRDA